MKSISQLKLEVHKNGKRIDKEILDIKVYEGMVCFVDKKSVVHWAPYPHEVGVYYE